MNKLSESSPRSPRTGTRTPGRTPGPVAPLAPLRTKPAPRKPDALARPAPRPSHLLHDAESGQTRVRFPAAERNSDCEAIEQCLNQRLAQSALGDDPRPSHASCRAADALVQALVLLDLSPEVCLSLVHDDGVWAAFVHPVKAPTFVAADPVQGGPGPGLSFAPPVDRRAIAALLTALLERAEVEDALRLFQACPRALDRRMVLKWLLKQPGPAGGPLRRLNTPEAIRMFDQALTDMLDCRHPRGHQRYAEFKPTVDALRAHWHPPAAPPTLRDIRQQLGRRGCFIDPDGEGHQRLLLIGGVVLDEPLLDLLLAYCSIALEHKATAKSVPDLMRQALACLGLAPGPSGASETASVPARAAVAPRSLRFVRHCCTLLLRDAHHAPMIETLVELSLTLDDPELFTDEGFQQAALQALQRDGLALAWIACHYRGPERMDTDVVEPLLDTLRGFASPQAALRFIDGVTQFLATLQSLAATHKGPAPERAWRQARAQLLPAMVKAFATLVDEQAHTATQRWSYLAQWVWVTDAALHLLPADDEQVSPGPDSSLHAPCLTFFHQHRPVLQATLSLLCTPALLHVHLPPTFITSPQTDNLFRQCRPEVRRAVLRLPLHALWPHPPEVLDLDRFFLENPLTPEQRITHLIGLLRAGVRLVKLNRVLGEALDAAAFAAFLTDHRSAQELGEVAWWVVESLNALLSRLERSTDTVRPAALPNLLALFRRITVAAPAEQRQLYWAYWRSFLGDFTAHDPVGQPEWHVVGINLPLGPTPEAAQDQLHHLSGKLPPGPALVYMLQGWLQQRFAEATDPAGGPLALGTPDTLFQAVWARTQSLMGQLSREQRKELRQHKVKVALKSLALSYEALLRKS